MTATPLRPEIVLEHPDVDEVRDFTSLTVRIRDENDKGINIDFDRYLIYRKMDETWTLDHDTLLARSGKHWLYEIDGSEFLEDFKKRNPHADPRGLRHYLIVTDNDVIDVIANKPPTVSVRSDNIRGWIRPGETRSG